jgi:hypothetical protein
MTNTAPHFPKKPALKTFATAQTIKIRYRRLVQTATIMHPRDMAHQAFSNVGRERTPWPSKSCKPHCPRRQRGKFCWKLLPTECICQFLCRSGKSVYDSCALLDSVDNNCKNAPYHQSSCPSSERSWIGCVWVPRCKVWNSCKTSATCFMHETKDRCDCNVGHGCGGKLGRV